MINGVWWQYDSRDTQAAACMGSCIRLNIFVSDGPLAPLDIAQRVGSPAMYQVLAQTAHPHVFSPSEVAFGLYGNRHEGFDGDKN